ncbi:hypothetical protein U3516DRAFT_504473, partial [Neocallimastix sp. 'constans']
MLRSISNTIFKNILFIIFILEIGLVSTKNCHNSLDPDYSSCSWLSECVVYTNKDKEYKMGTQTSHCKRKEWILPLFCFIGVIIAVIIGYVLFHFRKEQMEPILRPGTFYQPKNSFFKSRFHNKHSPFKNLSYNPSMIYNGNTSSLSGLKAMDNRKNYQNLEIPINFNNGNYRNNNNNNNNYNNNATNNNYQDLDPTTYPEYDNTVEIITDDRSNINGINQMSTINSMNNVNSLNKNGMNINNIIRMNNENRINTMN